MKRWLGVAAGFAIAVLAAVGAMRNGRAHQLASNEAAALDAMRHVREMEETWRREDADGNGVPDFWTGDWSGLNRVANVEGGPRDFIDARLAGADASPLPTSSGPRPRLLAELPKKPWQGYFFQALRTAGGAALQKDGPDADANAWENLTAWGFAAYPADPGVTGRETYVALSDGSLWAKDNGAEKPPLDWPADPASKGWRKLP